MINLKELNTKSEKLFHKVATASMLGENLFPLVIPANKQLSGTGFKELNAAIIPLYQQSKEVKGKGYSIDWKERNVQGSKQSIPARIYFETLDDYLVFAKKENEFTIIINSYKLLVDGFPTLSDWLAKHPRIILENAAILGDIIKVCRYFMDSHLPHSHYMRELPIEVHTKFIEDHVGLLRTLLDMLLPDESKNTRSTDFAERYLLKKANVYTQIRILDEALKPHIGYDECALTLEDASWLDWLPDNVFIIENKTCFLTFPKVPNSVAIFGEGFKSKLSRHLSWLAKTNLYCWFDLDAEGFEMLNMIREQYPSARSLLMDRATYDEFVHYSLTSKRFKKQLSLLHAEEQSCYQFLIASGKRLEQEKVSQKYVCNTVGYLSSSAI